MKKLFVVGVIILFLGLACAPSINANIHKESELVEITISNHRENGRVEKTTIKLSKEKASELAQQIKQTDDPEEQFSLYKEYGIIPKDVTREQLRQKMLMVAKRLGITQDKIESIYNNSTHKIGEWFRVNFLNNINGYSVVDFNLPIGLSFIIGIINYWLFYSDINHLLPSFDLLYTKMFIVGVYNFVNGSRPDFYTGGLGAFLLIGFVGYVIETPIISVLGGIMHGFSVASFVYGHVGRTSIVI